MAWIVALVAVSVIGSNVGSTFSQGFSLTDTESARAAQLLETRFPARAGDEGQIVFAHSGGVQDAAVQTRMEQLFADVAKVPGRDRGREPVHRPTAPARSRVAVTSRTPPSSSTTPASKIPDSTIEHIRDAHGRRGTAVA